MYVVLARNVYHLAGCNTAHKRTANRCCFVREWKGHVQLRLTLALAAHGCLLPFRLQVLHVWLLLLHMGLIILHVRLLKLRCLGILGRQGILLRALAAVLLPLKKMLQATLLARENGTAGQ